MAAIGRPVAARPQALPRAPVFGWSTLQRGLDAQLPSIEQARHVVFTTSGRAALSLALQRLHLPARSGVLVPTYHCPTMVAPIHCAGLQPIFFPIDRDGLPELSAISIHPESPPRAMIVAHYFGIPRSLARVRAWCDAQRVALIEDCAHCYFGMAGERTVGAWGDYAAGSISKFFPVPEAGVLTSATHELPDSALASRSITAQLKGVFDVLELSARHKRLFGLNHLLNAIVFLKNMARTERDTAVAVPAPAPATLEAMVTSCDMGRVGLAPLLVSRLLSRLVPRSRIADLRRTNFSHYHRMFQHVAGARPLFREPCAASVPYVFPLWVDDADRVYDSLRAVEAPVFRWDRLWPGTPTLPGDHGGLWNRHVLQLLCHQDLTDDDIEHVGQATLALLGAASAARPSR